MAKYISRKSSDELPRLPLEGCLDLTYRCNNNCRHCWLYVPDTAAEASRELTFDEIRRIVDEARAMGCRSWSISGGEPMLRPDFEEIFGYLSQSGYYTLNTNGTLITPRIAALMKGKGANLVSLYGATAEVHDHITRTLGSFDAFLRGCSLLKEAGAAFVVLVVPMKANFHQYAEMMQLAGSITPYIRIGAVWLHLSASGDPDKNREIVAQRLMPEDVIKLGKPDISYAEAIETDGYAGCANCDTADDDRLFAACISARRAFHVDPYGQASFCGSVKEPSLRYDLRNGSFSEFWDIFIPSLADKVRGGEEYRGGCGACERRKACKWCGVHGYLEHRRPSAKVEYLCALAGEKQKFIEEWKLHHRRYFRIADITIQVDSDIPFEDTTFNHTLKLFEVDEPGEDIVSIRHHFSLPDIGNKDLGKEVYRGTPWAIYRKDDFWIYLGILSEDDRKPYKISVFNKDFTRGRIYNLDETMFRHGGSNSLCFYSTDQILLARILADRNGFFLHSSGLVYQGHGLLFVGHSEAGKSTMVKMLREKAEILCDDRIILRKKNGKWIIHGTWSHGEVPDVSPGSAPLRALFFLEQSPENKILRIDDKKEAFIRMLACVIKPVVDPDWWGKTLSLVEAVSNNIPCYKLLFDKSGRIVPLIETLVTGSTEISKIRLD